MSKAKKHSDSLQKILLSAPEAAAKLGIGKSLFYQMVSTGRLGPAPVEFNSKKLWSVAELRLWVEAGCPCRDDWTKQK